MGAVLALCAGLLVAACAWAFGLPWPVALFVTGPLAGQTAYTACHLGDHKDPP